MGGQTAHDGLRSLPELRGLEPELLGARFVAGSVVGFGSFGYVVKAHDMLLKRDVAIKFVPSGVTDTSATQQLIAEARAASAAGPSAVAIHDVRTSDAGIAIVMELLARGSLISAVRAGTSPTIGLTLGVATARSMASVHRAGVLHLDLHPGNVLLRDDETVAIGDFGLAQFAERRGLSRGGHELSWTAPELLDFGVASPQADVYSLGLILRWIARRTGADFEEVATRATQADRRRRQVDPVDLLEELIRVGMRAGTGRQAP